MKMYVENKRKRSISKIFNFIVFLFKAQSNSSSSHSPQSTSTITSNGTSSTNGSTTSSIIQKRLHVSNIPFRFRDEDLKAMFEVRN